MASNRTWQRGTRAAALLSLLLTTTGCAEMLNGSKTEPVAVRDMEEVSQEVKRVSSRVLDITALRGETTKRGPGFSTCSGHERGETFTVHHYWSLSGTTDQDILAAMERLKEQLPKEGWKIVHYGRKGKSDANQLELTADHDANRYGLHAEAWEKNSGGDTNPSMLLVDIITACYEVPEGEVMDRY